MDSNKRQLLMSTFFKPRNGAPDGVSQLLPDASQEKSESDRIAVLFFSTILVLQQYILVQQAKTPKLRAPK